MQAPDPKKILQSNPQLDPARIAKFRAFQERMAKAGADLRTKYRLEPALGGLTLFASLQQARES